MTRPIFAQNIPDGPFSFSDLECELVTIDGDIFERATVPRDRVGDLVMGEELQGRTNFRMEARKGDREVLSWETRVTAVGCPCWLRETASPHDGCGSGPLPDPSWLLLLPQFEDIMEYHCAYGPDFLPPSALAEVPIDQEVADAAPQCGCQYRFTVYHLKEEPTLARVERALLPHSAHTSYLCPWISTAGREAVAKAFEGGMRNRYDLKNVLMCFAKRRFGVQRGRCLTDGDVRRMLETRPDLARDYLATPDEMLCVGVGPRLEGRGGVHTHPMAAVNATARISPETHHP